MLSSQYRLQWQENRRLYTLLYPEGIIELNDSATEILQLCNGKNSFNDIVTHLQNKYSHQDLSKEIAEFLDEIFEKGWIIMQSHTE